MRRSRVAVLLLLVAFVAVALLLMPQRRPTLILLPMSPPHGWMPLGQSQTGWQWVGDWRDWRTAAWVGRTVEWDEPPPAAHDTPGQVYQVWDRQVGPVVLERCRRVLPEPGENVR